MSMDRQGDHHANRDIFDIGTVQGNVIVQNRESAARPRNEQLLLNQVRDEVKARLESSLHHAVFLNLEKESQPEQVRRPWDQEIKIGTKPATPLASDTSILQVFDSPEVAGKLLILGQPGAGKTTTLLDLTQALVERATAESHDPMPVLFNLSTWKDDRQSMSAWLVDALLSKYGVSRKLGQQWLKDRNILPLLDGLDEVAAERQAGCVARINEYLMRSSLASVCSGL